ncbi:MAG: hypothetical protein AAFQ02_00210 [Bacteroidota bacterium]
MYQLLSKRGQLFAILLGVAVSAIYLITVLGGLSSNGYSASDDLVAVLKNNPEQKFGFFDLGLQLTLALIVIAVVAALLFGIWQLVTNIKGSLKWLIALAVIAIVFFAIYSSADTDANSVIGPTLQEFNISDNVSKLITGGLFTTLILAGLALVSGVLLEIYNIFK